MKIQITTKADGGAVIEADTVTAIGWWLRAAGASVTVTGPGARDIVEELRAAGVDAQEG